MKLSDVKRNLKPQSLILFEWFRNSYLKANSGKSHVMSTRDNEPKVNSKGSKISNDRIVKLLGVTLSNKLSFEHHLNLVFKKVSQKLHTFARFSKFISKKKLRVIMKTFIILQFSYCPFVWMCHSKTLKNKINKLYERASRFVYKDRQSTFEELPDIDKSVTTHHTQNYKCAEELYKVRHGSAPEFMNDIFKKRNVTYNFRKNSTFETRNVNSCLLWLKNNILSRPKNMGSFVKQH